MRAENSSMPTDDNDTYNNDPQHDPETTQETTQELLEGELNEKVTSFRKSRAKRTKAYKKLERKYFWVRNIACVVCLALLTGMLLTIASLKRVSHQNLKLQNDIYQLEKRNEGILADMQTLKVENDTLVQGRIPGLTAIKFDDPFKMESKDLKSIVFTQTEYNEITKYEYLAVIHNNSEDVIRPSSRILFFDDKGVQIGEGKIAIAEQFGGELHLISLEPGESHSFSGEIEMKSKQKPKFFKVVKQGF